LTPERWAQIEELFHRATECDPKLRACLLDGACKGDEELRQVVEGLLESEESARDDMKAAVHSGLDGVMFPLIGETVSHYRILEGLGGGGMGSVYRAEDIKLGRQVALKFLPEESTKNAAALSRFEREARSASALEHPNVCPIYEFGEYEGQPFLVMQLLDGWTLRELIAAAEPGKPPLPLEQLLDLAVQITGGLDAAHQKGIIHRDIKPANIFITKEGQAKILDFGLAKLFRDEAIADEWERTPNEFATGKKEASSETNAAARDSLLSRTGAAMGTAGYMSPEQTRGERLDARTDLFSLGAVLYEMASGEMAFLGNTVAIVHEAILNGAPTPLAGVNPDISPELERIVNKALEKERKQRYQSAAEIRRDLQRLKRDSDLGLAAATTTTIEAKPAAKSSWFRWMWPVAATLLIIALAAGSRLFSSRKSGALTDRDTIMLADFTNETGDPVFDHTLREGLAVELEQSSFISLVSEPLVQETLRLMRLPPDARLNPEVARELCQRTQGTAVLAGTIWQIGTRYNLVLKATSCASGELVASTETEASDKSHVLDALGKATAQIRKKLGESLSSIEKLSTPLEQATTPSLEALQAYTKGRRAADAEEYFIATSFFSRAISLDPNFAMAYASLGTAYYNIDQEELAAGNLKKAYDLRDHVSEREKFYIESRYHQSVTFNLEKACQVYENWAQAYPRDVGPTAISIAYLAFGYYDKALAEDLKANHLAPSAVFYANVAGSYTMLNRLDEARVVADEALKKNFDSSQRRYLLYDLAFLEKDRTGMAEQVAWAAGKPGIEDLFAANEADSAAYVGQLAQSRELTRRAMVSAQRMERKEVAASYEADAARTEALLGNAAKGKEEAEAALQLSEGVNVQYVAAMALAIAGDSAKARGVAEKLARLFPEGTIVQSIYLPTLSGQMAHTRKDFERAIDALKPTTSYELGVNALPLHPVYLRGEVYIATHQGDKAEVEFRKILDHPGIVRNDILGALAHLGLARAYALQGETIKARGAYQDFLTLWKDADPDIPILKQAKAEYAKLR